MSEMDRNAMEMLFGLTKPGKKFGIQLDNGKTATFYVSVRKGMKYCHRITKWGTILMLEKPLHERVDFGF